MTPVLELKELYVSLRQHRRNIELVKGVSFSVEPGECLGILGESGSGKSMSMKAAMGLLDKGFRIFGSVRFQGEELLGKSAEELRRLRGGKVGIILQNPMTCFDPLYRIGFQIAETFTAHSNWGTTEIRRRSLDMLDKMRIRNPKEVLEKYPHQLSGGMLQRIMIGIAASMQPALLIADEPTTALDVTIQKQILKLMKDLRRELGTSIIFITHDLGVVAEMADRVAVMYAGQIVEQASVYDLFQKPLHPYTEGLINSTIRLGDGRRRLPTIAGTVPPISKMVAGCRFHPRCPYATPACRESAPPVIEAEGRMVRCIRYAQEQKQEGGVHV